MGSRPILPRRISPRKVLLVGWDAADWKVIRPLMEAGRMPHLRSLVENGSSGQISTLHPPISPMLWTSIATGKRPFQHGIHGFAEPAPDARRIQPVTNLSRTCKALWNILSQNHLRSVVVGWWPSHPAEPIQGAMVSDHFHRITGPLNQHWPLPAHAVHPLELAEPVAALRVHPDQLTPELVEPFVPLAREIDQDTDQRLGLLLRTLAEAMSVEAAAVWLLEHQAWDFFAVYFDSIDHFCHGFMKYHPPRQNWISERDFELYRDVVSTAYQFHDRALGRMLKEAGPETTVLIVSDHGFHPDHLRPASIPDIPAGPTVEHRDYGIVALRGSQMKKKAAIDGASVLDITPTILALFGLAIGEDMDGRVLSQAFVKPPRPKFIPSWEQAPGPHGRHPAHTRLDPEAARAALEQMVALGYIEAPDQDTHTVVRKTIQELRYNLGEAYQDAGRHREAHAIFSQLRAAEPGEPRFAARLFVSCQALSRHALSPHALERHAEMRRIAEEMNGSPLAEYFQAQVAIVEGRDAEGAAMLERLGLLVEAGDAYARLRRWREAGRLYELALDADGDNAAAHLGRCRIALEKRNALKKRNYEAAAHAALDALERLHRYPQAHLLLGRALIGMKKHKKAAEAFRAAISCNPNFPEAHVRLAGALEQLGDLAGAKEHRRLAHQMRRGARRGATPCEGAPLQTHRDEVREESARSENVKRKPLDEPVVVVTGLPRSGTSMTMQMLAAGGVSVLTDGLREADESNPHGYFEYEPVKNLLPEQPGSSGWLTQARGKAVKIVLPLLAALPPGLPCRVILCRRDLEEVLDSQERMLARGSQAVPQTPEWAMRKREILKEEFARALCRAQAMLAARDSTQLLMLEHEEALRDPEAAARQLDRFLGGGFDVPKMAGAVKTSQ